MKKLLMLSLIVAVHSLYAGFDFSKDASSSSLERQIVTQDRDNNKRPISICPRIFAPVCGITNPCPLGAMCKIIPIYKTFPNKCELKNANAKFAYKGTCKIDLQKQLDKNRVLWNETIRTPE